MFLRVLGPVDVQSEKARSGSFRAGLAKARRLLRYRLTPALPRPSSLARRPPAHRHPPPHKRAHATVVADTRAQSSRSMGRRISVPMLLQLSRKSSSHSPRSHQTHAGSLVTGIPPPSRRTRASAGPTWSSPARGSIQDSTIPPAPLPSSAHDLIGKARTPRSSFLKSSGNSIRHRRRWFVGGRSSHSSYTSDSPRPPGR
jgi:hypothetical protein